MAREYFCAYHSYLKSGEPLNDAEFGRLFRACLQYSMTGAEPDLRGNERFVWPTIKQQIDRDKDKYDEFCDKQRRNVSKRWDTTVYGGKSGIPDDTKHTKEKAKKKEKTKETYTPHTPLAEPGRYDYTPDFERFWDAYPKKVMKGEAFAAFLAVTRAGVSVETLINAVREQCRSKLWQEDGGRYISNPAKWLNGGGWENKLERSPDDPEIFHAPD